MTVLTATALAGSVENGYASLALDRLARQVRQVVGSDRASIVVRDRVDERSTIAVAGAGVEEGLVGSRLGIGRLTRRVLDCGEPAVEQRRPGWVRPGRRPPEGAESRAAAPISWDGGVHGVLMADRVDPGPGFGDHELDLLLELADLAGKALAHAERRSELLPTVRSRIASIAAAIDARDSYTAGHLEEVVQLARRLGHVLGLSRADLLELELSALLHDVGKLGVPDAILNKPAALDQSEWEVMRRHPVWAAELLPRVPGLEPVGTIVRHHHERWDGDGYPDHLHGERIPEASRIVAVCDAYHAMTSDRPYRAALPPDHAIAVLRGCSGSQFDPTVVEPLIALLRQSEHMPLAVRVAG